MEPTTNHFRLLAWYMCNKFEKLKECKIDLSKELMQVMHPGKWWVWCLPEDGKKQMETIFTDKFGKW